MQNDATDQLDVVVTHAEHAPSALAADRKGFDHQVVERGTVLDPLLELNGLVGQFFVG